MYAREDEGKQFTFDFAEGLVKNNLLMVDRETKSVWSQLHGRSISGPSEGSPLQVIPTMQTTWAFWREKYPDTRVMRVTGKEGRPYLYRTWVPGTPRPEGRPTAHDTSKLGLGLHFGGETLYFPLSELARSDNPLELTRGGKTIRIHHSLEGLTAWAESEDGTLLDGVLAYREGWFDFFPRSGVYQADQ